MDTYSFFSFKGGLGRTQAMINIAYLLAKKKYFVVAADMDLHAPGLTLMPEMAPENHIWPELGLIDFFWDALSDTDDITDLSQICYRPKLIPGDDKNFKGDLMFIPCGRMETEKDHFEYREKLKEVPLNILNNESETPNGKKVKNTRLVVQEIIRHVQKIRFYKDGKEKQPDFFFIDARTGFTEICDMVVDASDHIVTLFGFNEQNVQGLDIFLTRIMEKIPENNIPSRMSLVLSPVPDGEEALREERLKRIRELLDKKRRPVEGGMLEQMPTPFTIPYHPYLALSDDLIVKKYELSRPVEAYHKIADYLEGAVDKAKEILDDIIEDKKEEKKISPDKPENAHPLTHLLDWNLFCPDKTWKDIVQKPDFIPDDKMDYFLSLLASSFTYDIEEKKKLLDKLGNIDEEEYTDLIGILERDRNKQLAKTARNWPQLSSFLGVKYGEWLIYLDEKNCMGDKAQLSNLLSEQKVQKKLKHQSPGFYIRISQSLVNSNKRPIAEIVMKSACNTFPEDGDVFCQHGLIHLENKNFKKAIQYLIKAIEYYERDQSEYDLAETHWLIGKGYENNSQLNEAEYHYKKAHEFFKKLGNDLNAANVLLSCVEILAQNGQFKESLKVLNDAENLLIKIDAIEGVPECKIARAKVYYRMKEHEKAKAELDKAREFATQYGYKLLEREIEEIRKAHES